MVANKFLLELSFVKQELYTLIERMLLDSKLLIQFLSTIVVLYLNRPSMIYIEELAVPLYMHRPFENREKQLH